VASIYTTSQYTVIGYSGTGGRGLLWLIAAASGWLLWRGRRSGRAFLPHLKFEMWGTRALHGQAAGGKCGVDRSGELYGDGDGDGWVSVALGDVQLDGAVKAD
jgi:hypothetical protein